MANRTFAENRYSLEKQVVDLYLKVTFGASGAPTITRGKGFVSVAKNATGVYTITLQDKYNALLGADLAWQLATTVPGVHHWSIDAETVASTKTVKVNLWDNTAAGGVAKEPASGDVCYLHLALSNSSAF